MTPSYDVRSSSVAGSGNSPQLSVSMLIDWTGPRMVASKKGAQVFPIKTKLILGDFQARDVERVVAYIKESPTAFEVDRDSNAAFWSRLANLVPATYTVELTTSTGISRMVFTSAEKFAQYVGSPAGADTDFNQVVIQL